MVSIPAAVIEIDRYRVGVLVDHLTAVWIKRQQWRTVAAPLLSVPSEFDADCEGNVQEWLT